jgi:putative transposase
MKIEPSPFNSPFISELDGYRYTGHSALVGKTKRLWQDTDEVLGKFSGNRREAIRKYCEFVAAGIEQRQRSDFEGGGLLRSYRGWKGVMALRRGR